jgi:catechol 2,3-dioxygenase-like lactoylglutathione lyase family enzyme
VQAKTLDHVALWVADRKPIVELLTGHFGMHVISETDRFTLVGSHARHGKLTLFDAEGPREEGALLHVALRVSDLAAARAQLPDGASEEIDAGEGLRLRLVEAPTDIEYDLDHVALRSVDPERVAREYLAYGFAQAPPGEEGAPRVEVGGAFVEFHPGEPGDPERPLLNHLAVLVDSADENLAAARGVGIDVADIVDAENTYAVFLWAPERVRIEYVEHKPSFSLT